MSSSSNRITTTNNRTLKLFKSRMTVIEQLDNLDYDTSEYEEFSINEVDSMNINNQLHMTLSHKTDNRKIHVKYYLTSKQINRANLDNMIEDVYNIDNILTKNDTLFIIIEDEPNDTIINKIKYLYDHDGIFFLRS